MRNVQKRGKKPQTQGGQEYGDVHYQCIIDEEDARVRAWLASFFLFLFAVICSDVLRLLIVFFKKKMPGTVLVFLKNSSRHRNWFFETHLPGTVIFCDGLTLLPRPAACPKV